MEHCGCRHLPLRDIHQMKARNIKLWNQDEAQAQFAMLEWYQCPCKICPGAQPLKHKTILKHMRDFGQHPQK
jgi:hypothetical protein